jgi:peroxiredoxin Q/BCP
MKRYLVGLTLLAFLGCAPTATSGTPVPNQSPAASAAATGQPAPAPAAKDQNGATVDFAALYKQGPVLVYFYPKADTPGCTSQACSLRDAYQKLTDAGLTVIGVSTDDQASQKAFQEKYQLPFTLIPDPNKVVLGAFGVSAMAGMASREAFLIKDGQVVWHDSSASTAEQADDVLAQLASWPKASPTP